MGELTLDEEARELVRARGVEALEKSLAAEELCPGRPDLLPLVARYLDNIRNMARLVEAVAQPRPPDPREEPPDAVHLSAALEVKAYHAHGGHGRIFLAADPLGRQVAVKALRVENDTPDGHRRLKQEARVTARLEHPNIVPVFGLGTDGQGRPVYAMRFVEGGTLDEEIDRQQAKYARGEYLPRELLGPFQAACNAVAFAHDRGWLHLDLKPGNIKVGEFGQVFVLDWGLGHPVNSAAAPGRGTPGYSSPEQFHDCWSQVGVASDVYSLGAILFRILTGCTPDKGGATPANLALLDRGRARAAHPALRAICRKALRNLPEERYPAVGPLLADVERVLRDEPVVIPAPVIGYRSYTDPARLRLARWGRRHPRFAAGGAVLLLAVAVSLAVGGWVVGEAQSREANERLKRAEAEAQAQAQAEAAATTRYAETLRAAEVELLLGRPQLARELLYRTPFGRRGWEWDWLRQRTDTGQVTLKAHPGRVTVLSFGPDGRLASADDRGEVKIRRVSAGGTAQAVVSYRANGQVNALAFHPKGKLLACAAGPAGGDGAVVLLDAATGKAIRALNGHRGPIRALAFLPNGVLLSGGGAAGKAGEVLSWDPDTGRQTGRFSLRKGSTRVVGLSLSKDGTRLSVTDQERVHVAPWPSDPKGRVRSLNKGGLTALSPEGDEVLVADWSSGRGGRTLLFRWEPGTGKKEALAENGEANKGLQHLIEEHTRPLTALAYLPTGGRVVTGSEDGTLKLRDRATGRILATLRGGEGPVTTLAVSPDGHRLAAGHVGGAVVLWPTDQPAEQRTWGLPMIIFDLAVHPASGLAAVTGYAPREKAHGLTVLLDANTGTELRRFATGAVGTNAIAFHPRDAVLAAADRDGTVTLWDARGGKRLAALDVGPRPRAYGAVAFSRTGTYLAAGGGLWKDDGRVRVWYTGSRKVVWEVNTGSEGIAGVAFHPKEDRLAVVTGGGVVKVFQMPEGRELLVIRTPSGYPGGVRFSPDGRFLAVPSENQLSGRDDRALDEAARGEVLLLDADSGRTRFTLRGHADRVNGVAFSPDGRRLVSADDGGGIIVWDAATGLAVYSTRSPRSVQRVAFTSTGHTLITAGQTQVRWRAAPPRYESYRFVGRSHGLAFSADGGRLAAAGWTVEGGQATGQLTVWNLATGETALRRKYAGKAPSVVSLDPEGRLAVGGLALPVFQASAFAQVLDRDGRRIVADLKGSAPLAFSPNGVWLAVGGQKRVQLLHGGDFAESAALEGAGNSVAFARAGRRLAAILPGGRVGLWAGEGWAQQRILTGAGRSVSTVAFSPDGAFVAAAEWTAPGAVTCWSTANGQPTGPFPRTGQGVKGLAFISGRLLILSGLPGGGVELRLADPATGRTQGAWQPEDGTACLAASADGAWVAMGTALRRVVVWRTEALLRRLRP